MDLFKLQYGDFLNHTLSVSVAHKRVTVGSILAKHSVLDRGVL